MLEDELREDLAGSRLCAVDGCVREVRGEESRKGARGRWADGVKD